MNQTFRIRWIALFLLIVSFSVHAQIQADSVQWSLRYLATWKNDTIGNAAMKDPLSLCADPSGYLYVADTGNQRIVKWSQTGSMVAQIGGFGWGTEQLDRPVSVWAKNGLDVLVADMNNQRIVRFDKDLHYISSLNSSETWPEVLRFGFPMDAALGGQSELFCLDGDNRRILKMDVFGNPQTSFGGFDEGEGMLDRPARILLTRDSRILVSDEGAACIKVFDTHGNYLFSFGSGLMEKPAGIAEPQDGWLLVADPSAKHVLVFHSFQYQGRYLSAGEAFIEPVDVSIWKNTVYVLDKKRGAIDLFEWTQRP